MYTLLFTLLFTLKSENSDPYSHFFLKQNSPIINQIPYNCTSTQDISCIEKEDNRLAFINNITAMSAAINESSKPTTADIYFPFFSFDESAENQTETLTKIQNAENIEVTLHIATEMEDITEDIVRITENKNISSLHIIFYTLPENISEILDAVTWKQDTRIKLHLTFTAVQIDKNIDLTDILYNIRKMIKRNNPNVPIEEFTLSIDSLFYDFHFTDNLLRHPLPKKYLKSIPTKKLILRGFLKASSEERQNISHEFRTESGIPNISFQE